MIEEKLLEAAQAMPAPESKFEEAVLRCHKSAPVAKRHRLRPIATVLAVLLLFTLGVGASRYTQIQMGMSVIERYSDLVMPTTEPWRGAQRMLADYDYTLPETLMGHEFESASKYAVVPNGTPLYEAMFSKFYNPVSVSYSIVEFREDGVNYDRLSEITVNIGTTTEDYWRHYFGMDENNVWSHESMIPETYHKLEYRGYEIQCASTLRTDSETGEAYTTHWLHWIDEENQLCIGMYIARTGSTELLIECAKAIIDLNR